MDQDYWKEQFSSTQSMLTNMGEVENLRLIVMLLVLDRLDTIAHALDRLAPHPESEG